MLATMRLPLRRLALAFVAVFFASCATVRFDPTQATGFQFVDGPEGRYYAYVPKDGADRVRRGEKLPVILFLHGGGERGSDPDRPTQVGLGPYVEATHGSFPFVVLFPQCPRGKFWAEPSELERLTRLLDHALPRLGGDPDRVYLTGNSMGGYGTWLLAAEHPERFAAIAPICGGVKPPAGLPIPKESRFGHLEDPYTAVAAALGKLPVWAFHGAADPVISPAQTRKLVAALEAHGNPVKYTEYPGVGHASWDRAYADPALFTWFAAQRRGVTTVPGEARPGPAGN